jgi:hypothetical protein
MPIGINLRYDQGKFAKLGAKLSEMERRQVQHQMVSEVGKFLLGKVREYPPYRYVSRRNAYGKVFFTLRQQRWFFAALHEGLLDLPYTRTNALREAWRIEPITGNLEVNLVNEAYAAPVVMGMGTQSRMSKKIGWKTVSEIRKTYDGQMGRVALRVLQAWVHGWG